MEVKLFYPTKKFMAIFHALSVLIMAGMLISVNAQTYKIVDTGQDKCYDADGNEITLPSPGEAFYGQDGQYEGIQPAYQDIGDGTVTDLNTGLTWQSSPDANGDNDGTIEKADKLTWAQMQARISVLNSSNYGGYNDWRIPTIKELYSLTNFNGTDPSGLFETSTTGLTPFIDTIYFPFAYGQTNAGERLIDVQYASCNMYSGGAEQLFGFNFADGRIKGYGLTMPGGLRKVFSLIAVRGNTTYGINNFVDNGDQTITDIATGLMWTKDDSKTAMNWEQALAWAQTKNGAHYCGHNDWRLPNVKELHSIVDYTRSPDSTNSAAINPIFNCTPITNEAGRLDWPWFWTSTTHRSYNGTTYGGAWAIYVCFGRASGWMKLPGNSYYSYVDVHGAGAQRSSPKSGTYYGDYMGVDSLGHPVYGKGPQGDILRVNNFVRLVRNATAVGINGDNQGSVTSKYALHQNYPNPFHSSTIISFDLPTDGNVQIDIFNPLGQLIKTVLNRKLTSGFHSVLFDASQLTSGVYYCRLSANNNIEVKKMIYRK